MILAAPPAAMLGGGLLPLSIGLTVALGIAVVVLALRLRSALRGNDELRASEERFRSLFENAVDGVYESEPRRGFTRVNPAMAQILGYASPAEVLSLPPEQTPCIYVSPTRRDEFFAQLGERDYLANFESEIHLADGRTAWIKENVRAVRDAAGRILYLQGFVSDITARKAAELALRASEERYRVLIEHLPIGIIEYDYRKVSAWFDELRAAGVTDLDAWLTEHADEVRGATARIPIAGANAAALRLFGLRDLAEGIANLDRIYTPEVYAARQRHLVELWHNRTQVEGEVSVRTLDGRTLRLFYHWRIPVIAGRLMHERTQVALVDLTQMISAESALAAERERLSVTLRAMSEAVFTVNTAGVIQFMNEAASQLTAWPAGAAIGRLLQEVCVAAAPEGGSPVAAPLGAALAGDRPVDLPPHTTMQAWQGIPRRVEGRCAPVHDQHGRVIGAVVVMRDVTQRLQLDAELLRASKIESIGQLAGGIAHDFNNLLTVINGNLALALLDERVRAAGEHWLREAERGTLRARELTQQLLTFAKGGDPVLAAVQLQHVVREAAEFALHGASVRCEYDLAPDVRPAEVDKGQIAQVVQNLVINAVQAMPHGGTIRVGLRNETVRLGSVAALTSGDYVRIEISDTGIGIPPEHLPRVFEPFFTTREGGTGLGLATVYSVVKKHRGHVTVESAPGHGTTFRLWLPSARLDASSAAQPAPTEERLSGRVLFMDDEELIRNMTKALLERLGLDVTLTADGAAAVREYALARISQRPYDLVIVDLTVPGGMGGAEAMQEILKIDPAAKGIVSSGYSSSPVMANFRAHGFLGMVPKPYRMADFARTIREVLRGN